MGRRRSPSAPDVDEMRSELEALDAEIEQLDQSLNAQLRSREDLERRLAQPAIGLADRWSIEEQLDESKSQIQQLLTAKVRPQTRAGKLRAVLAPVIERERESAARALMIEQYEKLLEAAAMLARVREVLGEAREVQRRSDRKIGEFDTSIRKAEDFCQRWESTVAPRIRLQLASHRRFVAAVEDER